MSAIPRTSRRERRRVLRSANRRRRRGRTGLAPRPVQHLARHVDDAAFHASSSVRRVMTGDRPFVLGLVALLVLGVMVLSGPLRSYLDQHDRLGLLQRQVTVLDAANADLQQQAADLKDPAFQRLLARERYGYIQPGELAYVIVPPTRDPSKIGDPLEAQDSPAPAWYRRAWDTMTGLFG